MAGWGIGVGRVRGGSLFFLWPGPWPVAGFLWLVRTGHWTPVAGHLFSGGCMLLVDGCPNTVEDLRVYESAILDVDHSDGASRSICDEDPIAVRVKCQHLG